ncbi:DUF6166 domain-containing protein [Pseudomonas migulae]|uniref:Uncharacterized protein n=1 Tax=Pseudomonas migulae TaxID=78543 RepID=A0ABY8MLR2_9PSED|nr:DUF6166 domain-containing protein [Pseudomonas migulae]WGK88290.1 hypothetical protein MOQ58_17290 [Pseudomonas migulae]
MQISATQQNIELIERMFGIYVRPTQHHSETPDFHYYLKYVEGVPLVICKDLNTGAKYLLEHRRELYQDNGSFSWGSDGTSTHALATSLLAHHFNGQRPAESHIRSIVYNLISKLAPRAEHIIKTSDILDALNTGLSEENLMQHRAEALILGAEELGVEVLTIDSLNKDDTVNVTLKTGENLSLPMKLFGINDQFLKYLLDTCKSSTDAVKPAIRALVKVERSQSGELKSLIICGPIQYDN